MKKLLYKSAIMFAVWLVAFGGLFYLVKYRYVDAFYHKFTYPAASLVIGTSRAAQGILPEELQPLLKIKNYAKPLLNYAFTLSHSPYGPVYLASIKRKLIPGTRNGLYIVAVDPWSLAVSKSLQTEHPDSLFEKGGFLSSLASVNSTLNLTYLKEHYTRPYYRLVLDNLHPMEKLHRDGWLEMDIPVSEAIVKRRMKGKIADYTKKAGAEKRSVLRLNSLKETVQFLKQHGDVYMVRVPVSEAMYNIEQTFQPDFDAVMQQIAGSNNVPYLNYAPAYRRYQTTDGNHLYNGSSRKFSRQLAADILKAKSTGN